MALYGERPVKTVVEGGALDYWWAFEKGALGQIVHYLYQLANPQRASPSRISKAQISKHQIIEN